MDQNQTPEEIDVLDYEATLRFSQGLRRQIVGALTKGGVPTDKDSVDMILRSLKDMDATAINDRKNNIDQGMADSSKTVAEAMREFVTLQMNRNPFERTPDGEAKPTTVPTVDLEKLGDFELVAGEDEIGTVQETSAEFMERMLGSKDQDD